MQGANETNSKMKRFQGGEEKGNLHFSLFDNGKKKEKKRL